MRENKKIAPTHPDEKAPPGCVGPRADFVPVRTQAASNGGGEGSRADSERGTAMERAINKIAPPGLGGDYDIVSKNRM